MFDLLVPRTLDNRFRGQRAALWLFALVVLVKLGIGFGTIFNGHSAASSADGIPLDTFSPAGARAVVSLFAAWGFAQVMIGALCVLALVRYRAMVPLLFALLLLEHLGRKLIFHLMPVATTGTPPGFFINLALLALMLVGLALSLWPRAGIPRHA
jgi:hypothetical protein